MIQFYIKLDIDLFQQLENAASKHSFTNQMKWSHGPCGQAWRILVYTYN